MNVLNTCLQAGNHTGSTKAHVGEQNEKVNRVHRGKHCFVFHLHHNWSIALLHNCNHHFNLMGMVIRIIILFLK